MEYNLIIDADSILYTSCYRNQLVNLKNKTQYTKEEIEKSFNIELAYVDFVSTISLLKTKVYQELELAYKEDNVLFEIVFSPKKTFRNDLSDIYKSNRKPSTVFGIVLLKELISERLDVTLIDNIEADDVVITRAYEKDNVIIACIDKDIYTHSPAPCINYKTWEWIPGISQNQIEINYWKQALMGDSTDCIKGATGIGAKKAEKLLEERNNMYNYLLYRGSFNSDEEALLSMRLVRLDQYNNNELELWTPETKIKRITNKIVVKKRRRIDKIEEIGFQDFSEEQKGLV